MSVSPLPSPTDDSLRRYARYAAAREGYTFELMDTDAALCLRPCLLCGAEGRNGLARLEPDCYAYRRDNVIPACGRCAMMKFNHSWSVFLRVCHTVATHRGLAALGRYPDCFAPSPTRKTWAAYASLPNRVMAMDEPTFAALVLGDCYYCGKPNSRGHHNGVDRLDSRNRRYDLANTVPCCRTCNSAKWTLSCDAFLRHVAAVALHHPLLDGPPCLAAGTADDPLVVE